jgi:hypothetical protein
MALSEDFFEGLLAALRLRGLDFVETRGNIHHERFRSVAEALEAASADNRPGSDELPRSFRPSMATGLYGDLDEALLGFQQGLGSSPNPAYHGLKLHLTEAQAVDVLEDFSPAARGLLLELADAFIEHMVAFHSAEAELV